jgi:hypothetical protein
MCNSFQMLPAKLWTKSGQAAGLNGNPFFSFPQKKDCNGKPEMQMNKGLQPTAPNNY